jgi:hypothetical protein
VSDATERAEPSHGSAPVADLSQRDVLRWLGVGGGADPSFTQVQLEQDLALFVAARGRARVPGAVLFAGGPGVRAVQVLDPAASPEGDAHQRLRAELGTLLDPRPERDARFRIPGLKVDAPADAAAVLALLRQQLALPGERLDCSSRRTETWARAPPRTTCRSGGTARSTPASSPPQWPARMHGAARAS